jgi:hypothetical protein
LLDVQLLNSNAKNFIDISADVLGRSEEVIASLFPRNETSSVESPEKATSGLGDQIVDEILAIIMSNIVIVTRLGDYLLKMGSDVLVNFLLMDLEALDVLEAVNLS